MSRRWRVLVLVHEDLVPPDDVQDPRVKETAPWRTEYDVVAALRKLGHEVLPLGVGSDLGVLRIAMHKFNPHLTFNLLEEFHGVAVYDHHVVSYLELLKRRYTGCNPRGLMLAHDKALSKKILAFHRVPVPDFFVLPLGRKVRAPRRAAYPLLVKSLTEEGSVGIARASLVHDADQLRERAEFVHRQLGTDVIAERFIPGRELYVGILGNQRLDVLPIWELLFSKANGEVPLIATAKVKWDPGYQKKLGVKTEEAQDLPPAVRQGIVRLCQRAYRVLNLTGYARIDLRLTPEGGIFVLEANPNPQLAYGEDFAESAQASGISYEALLQRILTLGFSYRAQWEH